MSHFLISGPSTSGFVNPTGTLLGTNISTPKVQELGFISGATVDCQCYFQGGYNFLNFHSGEIISEIYVQENYNTLLEHTPGNPPGPKMKGIPL